MQNHQLARRSCFILLVYCSIVNMQPAIALETLPDITITAPETPLTDHINNPQQLDEEDITVAHERSIVDVIQGLPGVSASKTGGFGQPGLLMMRGAGGQGLVSIDGIPILLTVPGLVNMDTLPPEAINTIEIERGPGAAFRPFQALGGAIRLQTLDREETGGRLTVEGGSFGILRETLHGGMKLDNTRLTATLSRADAFDGINFADHNRNPEREPSHFTHGTFKFTTALTNRLKWQGSMLYRNSGTGIDTFAPSNKGIITITDDANSQAHAETWLGQSALDYNVTNDWNSQLQLGYTQAKTRLNLGPNNSDVFSRLFLVNWRNQHTLINDDSHHKEWQLIWGAQGRHEQGSSATTKFNGQRTMTAGFVDTRFKIGDFSAEGGVRLESYDQYANHILFKTAAAYRITPKLTARASAGNGFRLPSYTELFFFLFGNPKLKPERSSSGDIGLEWFPINNLRINANGYYQRYHDLITVDYSAAAGPITSNITDASIAGMELSAQYTWNDGLQAGLSYNFSDNRNLINNKALPYRPEHIGRIWGQKRLEQLPISLWSEIIVRNSTWNDAGNTLPVRSSIQLNASVKYNISQQFEIYVRGENLTNNRNGQFYGTSMPGAAVYGGFKLDF